MEEEQQREQDKTWDALTDEDHRRLGILLALDPELVARLVLIARQDEKMEWLWAMLRRTASTIAIIIGAIALTWDHFKNLIRGIVQ